MNEGAGERRTIGLLGATGIGVGAIVGGGILALAGTAFAATGPSAILAFAVNGLIAFVTALSFAEMSTAFPESGGTYLFAKKVLTVQAAFVVGWVVWFASIVAAVLYALGFASYFLIFLEQVASAVLGAPPLWLRSRVVELGLALAATGTFAFGLMRRSAGGGQWPTIGKVVLFAILIIGGIWTLKDARPGSIRTGLTPFFTAGGAGLLQAMGYTFIALQGFDLIAAAAGEVRDPGRNLPRSMMLSLAIALAIYLPLLFVVSTAGVAPGESIAAAGAAQPDTVIAVAAGHFLGPAGFWLVVTAGVLSMLSALQANLFGASRIAYAMARDRTLPPLLERLDPRRATPVVAVGATAAAVSIVLLVIPDVAAAGAAASLIFLISFALTHVTHILARRRAQATWAAFRVPWFPALPTAGAVACLSLALFQGIAVPAAGLIAALWLAIGGVLFLSFLSRRALVFDAAAEGHDPTLVQLRGRNPLVLVPIANPASAAVMVTVASALASPTVGRVLLLSVVKPPTEWEPGTLPRSLVDAQSILGSALTSAFAVGTAPEALTTVSHDPWEEIARVARLHHCESLLLGLTHSAAASPLLSRLELLMSRVECDVSILRAASDWQLQQAQRILVPFGGQGGHDVLLARLLASLVRTSAREITFLRVLPASASAAAQRDARRRLKQFAADQLGAPCTVEVVQNDSAATEIVRRSTETDLLILGVQRLSRQRKVFGLVTLRVLGESTCATVIVSRRG